MPDATPLIHSRSNFLLPICTIMSRDLPILIASSANGKNLLVPVAFLLLHRSICAVENVIIHFVEHVFLSCIARFGKSHGFLLQTLICFLISRALARYLNALVLDILNWTERLNSLRDTHRSSYTNEYLPQNLVREASQ